MKFNFMSHIGQDMMVCEVFKGKKAGYFLNFGAFDGVNHDNTFVLEKYFQWRGICVDANPKYYEGLCRIRQCICINGALGKVTGEKVQITDSHGLSSLVEMQDSDSNADLRKKISKGIFDVITYNPSDILNMYDVPEVIDYLSLDVEGMEFDVISSIDFKKHKIAFMSIEHNHVKDKQEKVRSLLNKFGYSFLEHYNDDYFYNLEYLSLATSNDFNDPKDALKRVLESYKIREY